MGNTTSSSPSKLRKNSNSISLPQVLRTSSPPHRHRHLGPEHIISPYPIPHPDVNIDTNDHHSAESSRALKSQRSHDFYDHGSSSLNVYSDNSSIRRSKSENAAANHFREGFFAAPPPYTREDASRSNLVLSEPSTATSNGFLDVPAASEWAPSHRRAVSASAAQSTSSFHNYQNNSSAGHSRSASASTSESGIGYGVGLGYLVGYGYDYEKDDEGGGKNGFENKSENVPRSTVDVSVPTTSTTRNNYSRLTTDSDEVRNVPLSSSPRSDHDGPILSPTSPTTPVIAEGPLDLLRRYDTTFIVDDSVSMAGEKWEETREALASLAEKAAMYDAEGVDIIFLNSSRSFKSMRSASTVRRLFNSVEPQGCSFLALKLEELLKDYLTELENSQSQVHGWKVKPINYIIITDGAPTDDPEPVIAHAAKTLDKGNFPQGQIGIQFVQIGDNPEATEILQQLDDDIAKTYDTRDIVDFTPYNGGPLTSELLLKILLGGIHKRIDRKSVS